MCGQIAQGFHSEVLDQNRSLDQMQNDMAATQGSLSDSLSKLGKLVSNGGSMHVCHLAAFAVLIFVLLYFAITRW